MTSSVLVLLLCLLIFAPTQARAGSSTRVEFEVHGTNGYDIQIAGSSRGGALLDASKGHTAVRYATEQANVEGNQFTATFGKLGRVWATFYPARGSFEHRARTSLHAGCDFERVTTQRGLFIGRIRFRGARHFTRLDAHHVRGDLIRIERSGCDRRKGPGPFLGKGRQDDVEQKPRLEVYAFTKRGFLSFRAGQGALDELKYFASILDMDLKLSELPKGGVPFGIIFFEENQGMSIFRLAAARGPSSTFTFNLKPTLVTLEPPAPFSGQGRYANCPSPKLKGSLAVSLPGLGKVALREKKGTFLFLLSAHPSRPCPSRSSFGS